MTSLVNVNDAQDGEEVDTPEKKLDEIAQYCTRGFEILTELAGSFTKAMEEEPWRRLYDVLNEIDSRAVTED